MNQTFLQPFLAYTTKTASTFTVQSETSANWEAASGEQWTVPINVSVSKVTRLGPFPFSFAVGGGYVVGSSDRRTRMEAAVHGHSDSAESTVRWTET